MKRKKGLKIFVGVIGSLFAVLSILTRKTKQDSNYNNSLEEKNPMEGKQVIFVEDEQDEENADGVRGHLEAIGGASYHPGFYEKYMKRPIDIVLSFLGLIILSPVFIIISLAIVIEDPGPVLFTQKRIGQNKQYFKLHKFRSMKVSTPHDVPTHMLDDPDQYITKVGKFIRAHSLDELPQIWDIFMGNMSVIGPRPALWNQDLLISERDKYGANDVKPGLTGWAQINGRDELEIPEKAKLDGEYVEKIGFLMDIKCFCGSIGVFTYDDSVVEGGTGTIAEIKEVENSDINFKVSIIMPAYNASEFIEDSINSIISQTYKNWELIIVDDASTDHTVEVVNKIKLDEPRIILVRNYTNKGVAESRNIAINSASGRYIAFLDSDDLWLPDKLYKQLSFMRRNKVAFSFSSYQKFDSISEKRGRVIRVPKFITADEILRNTIIGCLTVMVDRMMTGEFQFPNLAHMEDNVTWYKILKRGFVAAGIQEVLALYRDGNISLTANKLHSAKLQWNVYRKYFKFSFLKAACLFAQYALNALKRN